MKRILVTGGIGVLGRELVPHLRATGYTVRVMSRRAPNPGEDEGIEWAQAGLEKGTGVVEASAVPWSILRVTQFHEFADKLLRPFIYAPTPGFSAQELATTGYQRRRGRRQSFRYSAARSSRAGCRPDSARV